MYLLIASHFVTFRLLFFERCRSQPGWILEDELDLFIQYLLPGLSIILFSVTIIVLRTIMTRRLLAMAIQTKRVYEELVIYLSKATVTFVFSSRETKLNNAAALKEYVTAYR